MRVAGAIAAAALLASTACGGHATSGIATHQCGSFKYGTDGQQPGPSEISAHGTSCWTARAIALLGAAPGWRCHLKIGILFVCRNGRAVVTYYGE
jgi:hypothetical protein